jgi:hypothetical protein
LADCRLVREVIEAQVRLSEARNLGLIDTVYKFMIFWSLQDEGKIVKDKPDVNVLLLKV